MLAQTKNLPSLNSLLGHMNTLLTFKTQLFKLYFKIISYMRPYLQSASLSLSLSIYIYIYIFTLVYRFFFLDRQEPTRRSDKFN